MKTKILFAFILISVGSLGQISGAPSASLPLPTTFDCSEIRCPSLECSEGNLIFPSGACCPVCIRLDCIGVLCRVVSEDECAEGETVSVPPGECCPVCQPAEYQGPLPVDCSATLCITPECKEGQTLEVPKGECCPMCVDSLGLCPYEGQSFDGCPGCDSTCIDMINEERRFCPAVCRPGCDCPAGELVDTIAGRCVPENKCMNPCAVVSCAQGSRCKVNRTTNEAYCTEPSCDINNGGCAKDEICQLQTLQCLVPPCPTQSVECLGQEEVCFLPVVVGPCEAAIPRYFHNPTSGQCELFTYGGCGGNANNFETLKECEQFCGVPDPCATVKCRSGHRCEVFKPTGEAFCTPDCSLSNGGCAKNEICTLQEVQCVRAPCPPVVQCLDQCAAVRCPAGHRCEIYKPTGKAFCTPDCSLSNGGCRSDQICELRPVTCVHPPCPPEVQCSCPPKCSKEFCTGNPKGICSNPGPREIPGCTGDCQLTYCRACIFGHDINDVTVPDVSNCPVCPELDDYSRPSVCYQDWAKCAGKKLSKANSPMGLRTSTASDGQSFCLSPPCPRRG